MKIHFVTFYVNEIIKVLSSLEELLGVCFHILISDWRVNNDIDSLISIELHDFFSVDTTLTNINLVHNIENGGDTSSLKSLNIHFVEWIGSHEKIRISNSLEEEVVQEVAVGLVQPAIDDEALARFQMEAILSCSHLTAIFVRVFDRDVSLGIPLTDDAIVCFSQEPVLELLLLGIQEGANVRCLLLHHFHGDFDWLHLFSIFDVHPIDLPRNLADLEFRGFVILKYPFFFHVFNWMPNGEAHLVLLPHVVVVHDLNAGLRGHLINLNQLTSGKGCISSHH